MRIALTIMIFSFSVYAQDELQKFNQERDQIYSQIGESQLIPKNAFDEAYKAYYALRKEGRLSSSPVITFVNYSIPATRDRLVTVNIQTGQVVFKTQTTHGKNSGGHGSIATRFSNTDGSLQSSLGFFITGEQYSGKFGTSLRIDGISGGLNSNARSRAIVIHPAWYVKMGGRSYGCLALEPEVTLKAVALLKNKTLIYSFTSSQFASHGDIQSAVQGAQGKQFDSVPSVDGIGSEFPQYSELKTFQGAKPSVGDVGIGAVGGTQILAGSTQYEECQNLSNDTWENTVRWITSGKDPSEKFKGSWKTLNDKIVQDEIDNDEAVEKSQQRLTKINDCVALAHISKRTDFQKDNINNPETKKSSDGSITCKYENPQSQDYQDCIRSIAVYDTIETRESQIHEEQKKDFATKGALMIGAIGVGGALIQSKSIDSQKELNSNVAEISTQRANIGQEKINALYAVAKKIPSSESLYNECSEGFKRHGTVGIDQYKEMVRMYSTQSPDYGVKKDYCAYTVKTESKLIQNNEAKNQIGVVLKKYGKTIEEDNANASAALNNVMIQGSVSDSMGSDVKSAIRNYNESINSEIKNGSFNGEKINNNLYENQVGDSSVLDFDPINITTSSKHNKNTNPNQKKSNGYSDLNVTSPPETNSSSNNLTTKDSHSRQIEVKYEPVNGHIYNEKFYEKIELALANPSRLQELNLTTEQLKEYNLRLEYKNSLKRETSSAVGGDSRNINSKDKSIFEIISNKYMQRRELGDL